MAVFQPPSWQSTFNGWSIRSEANFRRSECQPLPGLGSRWAVPITFLDKHNPEQFELLNADDLRADSTVPVKLDGLIKDKDSAVDGKPTYARIVIRRKDVDV